MNQDTPKEIILQIIEDMYTSGMTPPEIMKEANLGMGLRQLQRMTKEFKMVSSQGQRTDKQYWRKL